MTKHKTYAIIQSENNKGHKKSKKNPRKEKIMKNNVFAFALSYLYSHSLHLSLEQSSEGLVRMRSYRDEKICKKDSDDLGWKCELIDS